VTVSVTVEEALPGGVPGNVVVVVFMVAFPAPAAAIVVVVEVEVLSCSLTFKTGPMSGNEHVSITRIWSTSLR
jgi:hypothetical protein